MPKRINFKRVSSMLGTKEKAVTQVFLEFFNSVMSVFEELLLLFQRSSSVAHILYDCICETLTKLLRRFVQSKEMDSKHGTSLGSINCKEVKLQVADKDIVIGDSTRKALKRTFTRAAEVYNAWNLFFFSTGTSYLQEKLPLGNQLLKQLRCLNPTKRNEESTTSSIQNLDLPCNQRSLRLES